MGLSGGDVVIRLTLADQQLLAGLGRDSAAIQQFGNKATATGAKTAAAMGSIGGAMTKWITLPVIAAGAGAAVLAMRFNTSMASIQTQAGGTAQDVAILGKEILNLAKTTEQGPNDLAKAMANLKMVSMTNVQSMDALKVASEGAAVGQTDVMSTAQALAAVWHTGIKGAGTFTSSMATMNAVVGAGGMQMSDWASIVGTKVLVTAKQFGISLTSLGGAMAALKISGMTATGAATGLRMAITLMGAPSTAAIKLLAGIHLNATSLAVALRQGGIIGAVQLLSQHMQGLSKVAQTDLLAKAFGGTRTAGIIMSLIGNMGQLSSTTQKVVTNTSKWAADVATQAATPEAKLKVAISELKVAGVELGNAVLPIFSAIASDVSKAIGWIMEWPPWLKKVALGFVGIAAAAGPVLMLLSKIPKIVAGAQMLGTAISGAFGGAAAAGGGADLLGTAANLAQVASVAGPATMKIAAMTSAKLAASRADLVLATSADGAAFGIQKDSIASLQAAASEDILSSSSLAGAASMDAMAAANAGLIVSEEATGAALAAQNAAILSGNEALGATAGITGGVIAGILGVGLAAAAAGYGIMKWGEAINKAKYQVKGIGPDLAAALQTKGITPRSEVGGVVYYDYTVKPRGPKVSDQFADVQKSLADQAKSMHNKAVVTAELPIAVKLLPEQSQMQKVLHELGDQIQALQHSGTGKSGTFLTVDQKVKLGQLRVEYSQLDKQLQAFTKMVNAKLATAAGGAKSTQAIMVGLEVKWLTTHIASDKSKLQALLKLPKQTVEVLLKEQKIRNAMASLKHDLHSTTSANYQIIVAGKVADATARLGDLRQVLKHLEGQPHTVKIKAEITEVKKAISKTTNDLRVINEKAYLAVIKAKDNTGGPVGAVKTAVANATKPKTVILNAKTSPAVTAINNFIAGIPKVVSISVVAHPTGSAHYDSKGNYTGFYRLGGTSHGPLSGYPAMLHGTETILPHNDLTRAAQVLAASGLLQAGLMGALSTRQSATGGAGTLSVAPMASGPVLHDNSLHIHGDIIGVDADDLANKIWAKQQYAGRAGARGGSRG